MKNVLVIIFLSVAVLFVSCDTDSTTETENAIPEIQSVTANPSTIAVGETTVLTCLATDTDGDDLSYTWTDDVGGLPIGELGSVVSWNAPNSDGIYTIEVIVRDSENSTSAETQVVVNPWACGSTITYEGKTYNTIQIGTQCWMKENLDVGTMIEGSSNQADNSTIEKYCYDNDETNCDTYGGLYQWNEAMQYVTTEGMQGICPDGWHIPTKIEYETLAEEVGDRINSNTFSGGNALKAIGQGNGSGSGTNTSGFSALLAGGRYFNGSFSDRGAMSYFFSSTEYSSDNANNFRLDYDIDDVFIKESNKLYFGFSVRCLKN